MTQTVPTTLSFQSPGADDVLARPMSQREASLRSWLAFPYYAFAGLRLRGRVLRLSPAAGPRSGKFGDGDATVRLLAVGDSSAAAVGIDHTDGALVVQLARKLHERNGDTVSWHISGHNSATSGQIRDHVLPNLAPADYTHVLLQLGMNDMKNWHSGRRFCREFGGLLYAVRAKFPEAKLFWSQGIDMTRVPAMPRRLATIANLRRAIINERGTKLCVERGAVPVTPLPEVEPRGFCRDGFHASEVGYDYWAEHLLTHWDVTPRTAPAAAPYI